MNKKLLMIISVVLCMVLCLCACTTGNGGETTGTTEPSGTTLPSTDNSEPTTEPTDDGKVTYTVIVKDSEGNPVVGVYVQICKENATCFMPVATDDNGVATWRLEDASDYYGCVTADVEGVSKVYFKDNYEVTLVWDAE